MQRIQKGDNVVLIAGKDKGKRGEVNAVVEKNGRRLVMVNGLNLVKKHQRGNPQNNEPGGIVTKEMPLDISNVMLVNPDTDKGDRVGFRLENERKVRFFKSNGKVVG